MGWKVRCILLSNLDVEAARAGAKAAGLEDFTNSYVNYTKASEEALKAMEEAIKEKDMKMMTGIIEARSGDPNAKLFESDRSYILDFRSYNNIRLLFYTTAAWDLAGTWGSVAVSFLKALGYRGDALLMRGNSVTDSYSLTKIRVKEEGFEMLQSVEGGEGRYKETLNHSEFGANLLDIHNAIVDTREMETLLVLGKVYPPAKDAPPDSTSN